MLGATSVSGALLAQDTLPAAAADTPATLTVTGGTLSISAPTASADLGTRANSVLGATITGSLGAVQVNDARSAAAGSGWVASAISSAITPPAGPAIAASAVSNTAGTIAKVGTATYTANDPTALTAVVPVVTAITFPTAGTGVPVPTKSGKPIWLYLTGAGIAFLLALLALYAVLRRRRRGRPADRLNPADRPRGHHLAGVR